MEGIDAWNGAVLQAEYDVLPVVGRISGMLPQQHKVRLDRSAAIAGRIERSLL